MLPATETSGVVPTHPAGSSSLKGLTNPLDVVPTAVPTGSER
jgi:hypothetical protein